ncbi:unnamed protein product [Musa textilis]
MDLILIVICMNELICTKLVIGVDSSKYSVVSGPIFDSTHLAIFERPSQ